MINRMPVALGSDQTRPGYGGSVGFGTEWTVKKLRVSAPAQTLTAASSQRTSCAKAALLGFTSTFTDTAAAAHDRQA